MNPLVWIYLVLISVIAILITVIDKIKARRGSWRISEAALLIIAALGGSVCMYLTMCIIRHKTKHPKFMIGIPLIFAAQVAVLCLVAVNYIDVANYFEVQFCR